MSTEFKPKKSVALSGIAAGSTALCTVGNTGNDVYYRGYDILEFAEKAEFEEIGADGAPVVEEEASTSNPVKSTEDILKAKYQQA